MHSPVMPHAVSALISPEPAATVQAAAPCPWGYSAQVQACLTLRFLSHLRHADIEMGGGVWHGFGRGHGTKTPRAVKASCNAFKRCASSSTVTVAVSYVALLAAPVGADQPASVADSDCTADCRLSAQRIDCALGINSANCERVNVVIGTLAIRCA